MRGITPKRARRRREKVSLRRNLYDWSLSLGLLFALVVSVALYGTTRVWSAGIVMTMIFGVGCLFMLRPVWATSLQHIKWPPGAGWLIALVLWTTWQAVVWAEIPYEAEYDALRMAGVLVALFCWTGIAGTQSRWRWLLGTVLFGMAALCWYALVLHSRESTLVLNLPRPEQYGMRASGPYMCPNHFAAALAIVMALCAAIMLTPTMGGWLRLLGCYTFVVSLPVLFLTHSRSGWLGMLAGVGSASLIVLWRRKRSWFYAALGLGPLLAVGSIALLWLLSPVARERIAGASLSSPDGAARIRLEMWSDTWNMIREAPLRGHGSGSFRWIYPQYRTHTEALWARYPHNEYLQVWAELGLVGLVILTGFFVTLLGRFFRTALTSERDRDAGLCAGAIGGVLASLVHAVFDFNLHVYSVVLLLTLVCGVASSCVYASRGWRSERLPRKWLWIPLSSGLSLLCLLLAVTAARHSLGYYHLWRGERESMMFNDEEAERHYHQALVMTPNNWFPYIGLGMMKQGRCFWERDPEYKQKLAEEAIALFEAARALNPYDYDAHFGKSVVLGAVGRREEAIDVLRSVVEEAPNHAFYLIHLAVRLRQEGRPEEAVPLLERAIQFGGGDAARLQLQQTQRALGADE